MAKTGGKIDPGFIGVPQFQRSTFDPVQFTRSMMAERRATRTAKGATAKKERQQNIDFLREQMGEVDIQAWEDTQGYKELSEKKQAIYKKALDYFNKGYNFFSPETPQEMALMRGFGEDLKGLIGEVDIWNIHKAKVGEVDKTISEQLMLPPEERTVDVEKGLQWKKDYITGEGSIQERSRGLQRAEFGVQKPLQSADMNEYMAGEIGKTIPGMDKQIKNWQVDPTTGDILKTTWEGVDPTRIRTGLRKVYMRTEGQEREFLDAGFDQAIAEGFDGDLNDWMVEKYAPEYAEKINKTKTAGTRQKEKMALAAARPPVDALGNYDLSDYRATKRYGTTDAEGANVMQTYQSMATLPMMSIFKNKGFVMPVTEGTVVKSTGQKAPEAIAAGTTPVDVSFIPTAIETFSIEAENPETGNKEKVTIQVGERIPAHIQREMEKQNTLSGDGAYAYIYQPYVEANIYKSMMKDPANPNAAWEIPDPKSEKMTTIRPYKEARVHLRNFAAGVGVDFKEFDDDVLKIQKQLNKERIKENEFFISSGL